MLSFIFSNQHHLFCILSIKIIFFTPLDWEVWFLSRKKKQTTATNVNVYVRVKWLRFFLWSNKQNKHCCSLWWPITNNMSISLKGKGTHKRKRGKKWKSAAQEEGWMITSPLPVVVKWRRKAEQRVCTNQAKVLQQLLVGKEGGAEVPQPHFPCTSPIGFSSGDWRYVILFVETDSGVPCYPQLSD